MKKILFFLFLICSVGAKAVSTEDYMYATTIGYDESMGLEFFDVCLEGKNQYTAYGVDIQLPVGLDVAQEGGVPGVFMAENEMYPKSWNKYSHSVSASFPNSKDNSHIRVACLSTSNALLASTSGTLFRVYVTRTYKEGTWPLGFINLYAVELNKVGQPYEAPDKETIVLVHSGETTLSLNVSAANHWSTCILPFTAAVPEGVKAYTVSSYDTENLNLKEEKTMEAYTPYILYSENGYQGTLSGTVDASGYPEKGYTDGSVLKGAIVAQTVKNGYVMQKQDGEVMFYKIKEGDSFSVPAGKCWLELPESSAKALSFTFEDETGIDTVRPAVKTSDIYLIDGRRVSEPQPGKLYIKGGAKYVKQ